MDTITYVLCKKYTDISVENKLRFKFEVVDELPEIGDPSIIYLKKKKTIFRNAYEEYVWLESKQEYEALGKDEIEIEGYVKEEELEKKVKPIISNSTSEIQTALQTAYDQIIIEEWEEFDYVETDSGKNMSA